MSKTRQESKLVRGDSEAISVSSDSSSDLSYTVELAENRLKRARSLSFDDLYSLAPVQNGLSINSKFAYTPLEAESAQSGVPKSVSFEDLAALAEAYSDDPAAPKDREADEKDLADYDDNMSVMSVPVQRTTPKPAVSRRRALSEDDARDRLERTEEIVPDETDRRSSVSEHDEISEKDGSLVAPEDSSTAAQREAEDESPAVRLFGRQVSPFHPLSYFTGVHRSPASLRR